MSPIGSSTPVSSPSRAWSRRASRAPRVWMPTIARALGIRVLLGDLVGDAPQRPPQVIALEHDLLAHFSLPSWPLWTGLKDGPVAARAAGGEAHRRRNRREARRGPSGSPSRAPFGTAPDHRAPGRDLDQVEVAGGDGRLEDLPGLLEHLADVVARGDVDEGEHLHPRLAGDRRRLADGRVAGFERPLDLLLGEAGVVDQQLGAARRLRPSPAGAGVAGDHDRPPGSGLAHHLLGRAPARRLPCDRLPALQGGEGGAFGHAEPLRGLEVETAGPLVLDQRVAEGAHAVLDLEGLDLVVSSSAITSPGSSSTRSSLKPIRPISRPRSRRGREARAARRP